MKNFLKRLLFFVLTPLLFWVISYIVLDPFKVLYHYNNYNESFVVLNREFVSAETYKKNKVKYNYNSFIFGSSRTLAFKADNWKKYLKNNDSPYVFDAAGEALYGIHDKLKYLDKQNASIDNVIIILCRDWSFIPRNSHQGHIFIKHPEISGTSYKDYHLTFAKSFFNSKFSLAYFNYLITKKYQPWMIYSIANQRLSINPTTNQLSLYDLDYKINSNAKKYYKEKAHFFFKRNGQTTDTINRIDNQQLQMLLEVKRILIKHKANFKIISGPLYDQIQYSKQDGQILKNIFGNQYYDYTGSNKFTNNIYNYYENSHYRPHVGNQIFEEIYNSK